MSIKRRRKKQLAAEAKKKEEEKKKLLAAQALAAKEMEMRNGWVRYVTLGSFTTEGDDKVKPFTIPVYNGFNVAVDKVTLRVDYLKKEKELRWLRNPGIRRRSPQKADRIFSNR